MAITGPLREVGKIYEMSGAAARTGNLKEKNVKNYIKKEVERLWKTTKHQDEERVQNEIYMVQVMMRIEGMYGNYCLGKIL